MKFFITSIVFILFSTLLTAADSCPGTSYELTSGIPYTQEGNVSAADAASEVDYFQFSVPEDGTIQISFASDERIDFSVGSIGCDTTDILNATNSTGGNIDAVVTVATTIYVKASLKSQDTDYKFTIKFVAENKACQLAPDFLTIDGSETEITGKSTLGGDSIADDGGNYYKFEATGTGGDINGTLKINAYSDNFNIISSIEFLDENCQLYQNDNAYSDSDVLKWTLAEYFTEPGTYYLHIRDDDNYNPSVVTSFLWYPDVNSTTGGGGSYPPSYNEPAIFKGTDVGTDPNAEVTTKIVNDNHNITVHVVKDDGSIYTGFKGSFMLELIDYSNYASTGCKNAPALKYDGILGITNSDNGQMTTGDDSTEHGPSLNYDSAHRNVSYRMTYLVDPTAGGIISYDDLVLQNGCLGNKQSCLWGVLTSLANGDDPYLPDFTIADVCGAWCQPGAGTGNNQVSAECAACVFGQFGYADCSDNFAVRPDHFEINATHPSYPDLLRAGQNYDLNISAVDKSDNNTSGYDQAGANLDVSNPIKYYPDGTIETNNSILHGAAALGTGFNFTNGLADAAAPYNYSDVGRIGIHIEDQDWAAVDADDTPQNCTENGAFVCGDRNATFIPDHFKVIVDLNNSGNGFTYLSNEQNMTANLNVDIYVENANDATIQNFTMPAYGQTFYENNITVTMTIPDHSVLGTAELNQTDTPTLLNFDHGHKQLTSDDANDTLSLWFNYVRETNVSVNPFVLRGQNVVVEVNSTYSSTSNPVAAEGSATITGSDSDDTNITYVYGRAHAPRYRAMCDGSPCTANVTFFYEFYADKDANATLITNLLGTNKRRSIDSVNWYRNSLHNTVDDGNITMTTQNVPGVTPQLSFTHATQTTSSNYVYTGSDFPYKGTITIPQSSTLGAPSWLIYDKYKPDSNTTSMESAVEYYGPGKWSSTVEGSTTKSETKGRNTNRRIRW